MKLEHFGMAEPGDCRLVFTASAEELAAALAKEQAALDAPQDEEELLTAAVNRTILEGFDPLYRQLVQEQKLVPVTDPDFELLAVNKAEGFRAGAQFYTLPPLELGRDTGFVQPIEPHPLRRLTIELEINRNYGDEERAADAAGKAALRDRVTRELYAKRCAQAKDRAEKELVWQLGDEVTGPVPKRPVDTSIPLAVLTKSISSVKLFENSLITPLSTCEGTENTTYFIPSRRFSFLYVTFKLSGNFIPGKYLLFSLFFCISSALSLLNSHKVIS